MTMSTKTGRLDLRLTEEQRQLLESAASIAGSTLTSYTIGALMESASATVSRAHSIRLSQADWELFIAALDAPDDPSNEAWQRLRALKPVWES